MGLLLRSRWHRPALHVAAAQHRHPNDTNTPTPEPQHRHPNTSWEHLRSYPWTPEPFSFLIKLIFGYRVTSLCSPPPAQPRLHQGAPQHPSSCAVLPCMVPSSPPPERLWGFSLLACPTSSPMARRDAPELNAQDLHPLCPTGTHIGVTLPHSTPYKHPEPPNPPAFPPLPAPRAAL